MLFADVVGYTRLSEHLDPERVKRLLDGSFAHLIDDIERFGGQVDKVMGDGILALFGAPISHEDDPDRAVRCALEMHRSLAEYVAAQPDLVQPVRLRVGVNTGEVVVGRVSGTDDYTALGDAVNVASRLQVMAPPGGTFIGSSTEEQLSADIRRELVADAEVRGREQTERVWRVLGRSGRVLSATMRTPHDYRFVGRTVQRELLDSVYWQSVLRGRAILRAVRWELQAQLEESLFEDRNTRLREVGVVPRVEALERYAAADPVALQAQFDEALVNAFLGCRAVSTTFTHVFKLGIATGETEYLGADQLVEKHDVGFLEPLQSL